jgi:hypothetical protein
VGFNSAYHEEVIAAKPRCFIGCPMVREREYMIPIPAVLLYSLIDRLLSV